MTYTIDGVQYVAMMAGAGMMERSVVDARHSREGRIVAMKLDGGKVPQRAHETEASTPLTSPTESDTARRADLERGKQLFERMCSSCHVSTRRAPDLTQMPRSPHEEFLSIVL
jgi:cytochrome c1